MADRDIPERPELRWHYGPTSADPNPAAMWCYDCGSEVLEFEEGRTCMGCNAYEPPAGTEVDRG